MNTYGKELIIDMHECDVSTFTRASIEKYFKELCKKINMNPEKLCWWDEEGVPVEERYTEPHLVGISAVQFITTSDIVIHTLSILKRVYLNIFSCGDFKDEVALEFSREWFKGVVVKSHTIERI